MESDFSGSYWVNDENNFEKFKISESSSVDKRKNLLDGEKGAFRDIVVMNSAAAIYISGIAESIEHGLKFANNSIDNGNAKTSLEKLVKASNEN